MLTNFIYELRRRNVFKVATAYAIAGWLIIQVVTVIEQPLALPDWFDTSIIILVAIGFPIALIIAWAFELTPDGMRKSDDVAIEESVTNQTGKKINRIIIGTLSLLIIFLLVERIFFAHSNVQHNGEVELYQASIAVLPFTDLSAEGDQEYFSDGLSEEILNVLANVNEMKVAGRTSSFKFKGQHENLTLIGSELGVNHILEGSVRKAGNRLRITAQLIKVEDGFHLWSESYDREYTAENIFDIQDEISEMVLNELKVHLLPANPVVENAEAMPTSDIEAYEAYLKGNSLLRNRQPEELNEAISHFENAIKLDPSFAMAYVKLVFTYSLIHEHGNLERDRAASLIEDHAKKAVSLNSNLGEAYAALGEYYYLVGEMDNMINAYQRAYELSPINPQILIWYHNALQFVRGRTEFNEEFASELIKQAYALDPLAPAVIQARASLALSERNVSEALALFEKNITINPNFSDSYLGKVWVLSGEGYGKLDEAFNFAYQTFLTDTTNRDFIDALISTSQRLKLYGFSDELVLHINSLYPDNRLSPSFMMNYYIRNGEYQKAIESQKSFVPPQFLDQFSFFIKMMEYSYEGSSGEGKSTIEQLSPEYLSDTLTTHPSDLYITLLVKNVLINEGEIEATKTLSELPCDLPDSDSELNKVKTPRISAALLCAELKNNHDLYARLFQEAYNRKLPLIYNRKRIQLNSFIDRVISEKPEFANLLESIDEDFYRMRNNTISMLKAEGRWQNSWDVQKN